MISDLYARKSTKDEGRSAARQERDWRADCNREDLQHGRTFIDPDLSASRYARHERPDYAKLLEHIRSGACAMVSLWEASRGSRQLGEWIAFLELCRENGVLIRIFGEDAHTYDPRKRRDWRTLAEDGLDAHDESERLAERVRAGTRDAAVNGKPPGPLLYGYTRIFDERGRYVEQVIAPERAARVRRWAADTLNAVIPEINGLPAVVPDANAPIPLHTQARALNDAGVPSPSGTGQWIGAHINRYLRNPGYLGHRVHHGKVVARGAWPAILDETTVARIRDLLEAPDRRHHTDSKLHYQLSGAALCGCCRRVLRVKPLGPHRQLRYHCPWTGCLRVTASLAQMDAFVDEVITARLRQPDAAAVFAAAADEGAANAARRHLDMLRDRLDEHVREATAGRLSARSLGIVERELQPQIDAAEREWQRLLTPAALQGYDPVVLADEWPDLPVGRRRAVILALAEVVLSPVGKGGRWSPWRLAESRWVGDQLTWGDHWRGS